MPLPLPRCHATTSSPLLPQVAFSVAEQLPNATLVLPVLAVVAQR
jgi:hypothetical protein